MSGDPVQALAAHLERRTGELGGPVMVTLVAVPGQSAFVHAQLLSAPGEPDGRCLERLAAGLRRWLPGFRERGTERARSEPQPSGEKG